MKPYYQNASVTLYHGDCLEIMPPLAAGSVRGDTSPPHFAAAITDPPFGCTSCKWDKAPDVATLQAALRAVCKRNAAKVFFSNIRFAGRLIAADENNFRYDLVYWKRNPCGILNARVQPLRSHENILVFYDRKPIYNPQLWQSEPYSKPRRQINSENYSKHEKNICGEVIAKTKRFPLSVIYHGFSTMTRKQEGAFHPTQKPVALIEWLVKTYTNEGETIIDPFAGSGTAGVAAMRTGRKAVLIELEEKYCEIAAKRLEAASRQSLGFAGPRSVAARK